LHDVRAVSVSVAVIKSISPTKAIIIAVIILRV
jgi:hypothetical protein